MLPTRSILFSSACILASMTGGAWAASTPEPTHLKFETHAAFFSAETKQPKPIDPQVFVRDAGVAEGTGPQGIKHAAGFRPALIETDAKSTPLFNAQGAPLGFTLAEWLAPTGQATMTPTTAGGVVIKLTFEHLRPDATYSLFENHFDQKPVGFTPLDGAGSANSFKTDAKGHATATVTAPQKLTPDNAILLILDDDGQTHSTSRGEIGVNAQHQLIARPPG